MTTLFDPARAGAITLKNRIVMAPLTRTRAVDARVPNALMRDYYMQRAGAGLILSEATAVTPMGVGYPDTPGIWNDDQVAGWRVITDAVHAAGGRMVLQLWHVGRISDPVYLDGALPVAPSAIAPEGHVSMIRPQKPFVVPRALETDEIAGVVAAFREGAARAKRAGFDGVEIHGANGYLFDQFLHDGSNRRTDLYGGSVENRARLLLEATDAAVAEWGADRVGVHLNLMSNANSMSDSDPAGLFGHVAEALGRRRIAFLFAREATRPGALFPMVRRAFGGFVIANDGLSPELAAEMVAKGEADAVSFGRMFIANPDLPERIRQGGPYNPLNSATIYLKTAEGYTDYPVLKSA
jgi:2,4-dienoyl-CoA reductase-like NADH-dependent reductase (Old Yellow Enzyme family)